MFGATTRAHVCLLEKTAASTHKSGATEIFALTFRFSFVADDHCRARFCVIVIMAAATAARPPSNESFTLAEAPICLDVARHCNARCSGIFGLC